MTDTNDMSPENTSREPVRSQCTRCDSQTFGSTCPACGSMHLRSVEMTAGDVANADAPLTVAALQFQRLGAQR